MDAWRTMESSRTFLGLAHACPIVLSELKVAARLHTEPDSDSVAQQHIEYQLRCKHSGGSKSVSAGC